jgi:hypothetical protein
MKSFKEFLKEQKSQKEKISDEKAASALLNLNSQMNPYNSYWVTDMYMANNLNPRPSMEAEEAWDTDVAMAFDMTPEGELVADPEGFKAVHKRTKEGRNVKFKNITLKDYRNQLMNAIGLGG